MAGSLPCLGLISPSGRSSKCLRLLNMQGPLMSCLVDANFMRGGSASVRGC